MVYAEMIAATNDRPLNVADWLQDRTSDEIQQINSMRKLNYSVACLNVTGDLNTGIIIRTATIFGAQNCFLIGRRKYDRRTTVGAHKYLNVIRGGDDALNAAGFQKLMNEHNVVPIFVEQGGVAIGSTEFKEWFATESFGESKRRHYCLVFGNEGIGIGRDLLSLSEKFGTPIVSVPQFGIMRSLNVSACAAIVISRFSELIDV